MPKIFTLPRLSVALSLLALAFSGFTIYLNLIVAAPLEHKSVRNFVLEVLIEQIEEQQADFSGTITDEGCYVLENGSIQTLIRQFGFTSEELGQSVEDLVCHGFLVPLDYSSERDA